MSSLEKRLNAYKKKDPNTSAARKPENHAESRELFFETHPASGRPLALTETIALSFTELTRSRELLFFDLESTGLGTAEQVYPFLIGCAQMHRGRVKLQTFYATTPAGEKEILGSFLQAAADSILVSFNGKSFDLPLIVRRAEKYNLQHKLKSLQHIDLYHLIRRIYPEKPARLIDAEIRLLGFARTGDISGAEVAQAYFESLRFDQTTVKEKILEHNICDVLSLVSLTERIAEAFAAAREGKSTWAYKIHRDKSADRTQQKQLLTNNAHAPDARDLYILGQIFRSEKNLRRAIRYFLASYRAGYTPAIVDAVRSLSRLKKKRAAAVVARWALAREDDRVQRQLIRYLSK